MRYSQPETAEEVVAILAEDADARCLAGGATLVAMLNAGLVAPSHLVSLRRVDGLAGIARLPDGRVRVGAMTRHAAVAAHRGFCGGQAILAAAARRIGHPAIRNMGTIGGSICHADPSADYPTAICAAGADVEILGPAGVRTVRAADFFMDWFETALGPGEIVTAVTLPVEPAGAGVHYEKFTRADGDFATVSVAAVLERSDGACRKLQVAVGGAAGKPVRDPAAEATLVGGPLDDARLHGFGEALAAQCDPVDDMRGSAAYRLKLVPRLVARALRAAQADETKRRGAA